nr:hypothetical protein MIMGU_mgv1a0164371mg [Ipomoea trifida]
MEVAETAEEETVAAAVENKPAEAVEVVNKPAVEVRVGEAEENKPEVVVNKPVEAVKVGEEEENKPAVVVNKPVEAAAEKPEQKPEAEEKAEGAAENRPLIGPCRQAIPAIIKRRQRQTSRRFTGKEVIRVSKILKPGKLTYTLRYRPGKHIMPYIELLQANHLPNLLRQRPQKLVKADVKHRHILQHPNFRRKTGPQSIIHQNNLIQITHIPDTRRHTAVELIIRQNNHRNRRITEIIRQFKGEAVVVDEYSVQGFIEELRRQAENDVREFTGEAVVAEVKLEENLQVFELLRDGLESDVGVADPVVLERQRRVNRDPLAAVSELVAVVQQLAALDVVHLRVRQRAIIGNPEAGGGGKRECGE